MKKIVLSIPDEALPRIEKAFTYIFNRAGEIDETPLETVKRRLCHHMKEAVTEFEREEARRKLDEKSEDLGI
jgi:hypothetical protein